MFIKSHLLIHAKEKKNVRYVAAGNYQIEFFSLTGKEYFGIYSPYGGDNFCLCLPLGDVSIATIEHGYQIHHGALTYKVLMRRQRRGHEFALHRLLWGWLPTGYRRGPISPNGIDMVHGNLEPFIDSIAA